MTPLDAAYLVIRRRDDDWYPSDDLTVWWRIETSGREFTEPMSPEEAEAYRVARGQEQEEGWHCVLCKWITVRPARSGGSRE